MAEFIDIAAVRAPRNLPPVPHERFAASLAAAQGAQPFDTDAQFIALLQAFRPHGGLARLTELTPRLRRDTVAAAQAAQTLTSAMPALAFGWSGVIWVPLFQFAVPSMALRRDVQRIVAALQPAHDGWQAAAWFTRRSASLGNAMPIERLADDAQAVLHAALQAGHA